MTKFIIFSIAFFLTIHLSLSANSQTFIDSSGQWEAYRHGSGKKKICYIASEPIKKTGRYKKRGETFILVTSRPSEKQYNIFELRAGYVYKKNSPVTVMVDSRIFQLFTHGSTAWAKSQKIDTALSKAMIRGLKMTVTGTSSRGTKTVDTYSLNGFTAAHNSIRKACGIK